MKYFMVIWESLDHPNAVKNLRLKALLQDVAGKEAAVKTPDPTEEFIAKIGTDCEFMGSPLPNVVFFKTENFDITEESVRLWLKLAVNGGLFQDRYVYIKEVSSPYHVGLDALYR